MRGEVCKGGASELDNTGKKVRSSWLYNRCVFQVCCFEQRKFAVDQCMIDTTDLSLIPWKMV